MAQVLSNTAVRLVLEAAAMHVGIEPALLKALAWVESSWNPRAISKVGAKGLCQLMPGTAKEVGCSDAFDPMQNALGGAIYLQKQLKRFGEIELALAAYNWGPRNVAVKHVQNGGQLPGEVRVYIERVLTRREHERLQSAPRPPQCDLCGHPKDASKAPTVPPKPPPKAGV